MPPENVKDRGKRTQPEPGYDVVEILVEIHTVPTTQDVIVQDPTTEPHNTGDDSAGDKAAVIRKRLQSCEGFSDHLFSFNMSEDSFNISGNYLQ